jgi:hypothetical protein
LQSERWSDCEIVRVARVVLCESLDEVRSALRNATNAYIVHPQRVVVACELFDVADEVKILFEQVSNASISLDNVILEVVPMFCNR